ncbi:hypothetical protein ABZ756_13470 [Mammaliicoccus sciuri]|uniref:Uncharacterized protein n=1 Tax=Sporosarcina newyorkensis TaxID=759851 RepID=A0A1T4YVK0_9BACL|nr:MULTISPECIES: hypothetical protein [Sporosarcina]MBY0223564.1 hypothetical protein [Sporosarcina aquimarina]SKB05331.1 hypothetical protein SAMN04244570_3620 [Sporosarcina newyorkensis]
MKKQSWILTGIVLLGVVIGLAGWFYLSEPVSFPTDAQLMNEIHEMFPEAAVDVIQDIIHADERHTVVPFISERQEYGLSYWIWKNRKWQVAHIDMNGEPRVWKVDQQDPSSYHFVWNISPADQLSTLQLYMIRERGQRISEEVVEEETYYPRVQMEWVTSLKDSSYGVMPLPEDGVQILDSFLKTKAKHQPELFFENFSPTQEIHFSWIAKDQSGNEAYPESSVNGDSYSVSNISVDYMMIFSEEQLELPDRK